jgi:hypothetical protein
VADGVLHAVGEAVCLADGADADLGVVDAVGVGELVELLLDQVEEGLALLFRPLEVLGGERVERQFPNPEFVTPVEDLLGRLGPLAVAFGLLLARLARVAPIAVLDDCDVGRCPGELPPEDPLVPLHRLPAHPREHYWRVSTP